MSNIDMMLATIAVLTLGYPLGFWIHKWVLRTERKLLSARLRAEAEQAFMEGTRIVVDECANLKVEVERAREVAGAEREKTARYFAKISEFERQRTTWQELYHSQTIGHGNAQELMMTTIENLARQLQSLGQRPRVPSVLHALRSEYLSSHEMPARAAVEAIETAKASLPPPQLTTE